MSDNKQIVVWLPLRPGSAWRGEGIAQTVENIISTLDSQVNITIFTTSECEKEFDEKIRSKANICVLKWISDGKKKYELKSADDLTPTLFELINARLGFAKLNKIKKINVFIRSVLYVAELRWVCMKINAGIMFPQDTIYWFPAPGIYGIDKINKKKVISFWDPFVFEYRDFGGIMGMLYLKFFDIYRKASGIITQSESNKRYLIEVMGINCDLIKVINNGSPDYSRYFCQDENLLRPLDLWLKKKYIGSDKYGAISAFVKDKINKSILWRLMHKKTNDNAKTIIISTQDRPYKGLRLLLKVIDAYVKRYGENINIVSTSQFQDEYRKMYPRLIDRIYEITRVSEFQHALLYSVVDLVIHPSFVEGGLGAYPQFEAASMKKPSLVNLGRHVSELIDVNKLTSSEASLISVDFTNIDATCEVINNLLNDEKLRAENIEIINKCSNPWSAVGLEYSRYFKGL